MKHQLWASVSLALVTAILASSGLAYLIVRPLRVLASKTERLCFALRVDGSWVQQNCALALAKQHQPFMITSLISGKG